MLQDELDLTFAQEKLYYFFAFLQTPYIHVHFLETNMSQQHTKAEKRVRRKRYIERLKERAKAAKKTKK